MNRFFAAGTVALAGFSGLPAEATPIVFSATGPDVASIQATIDSFRTTLGELRTGTGPFASGRREINWDGVGAASRDPFPVDFFNSSSPRGVVFSTPGERFVVSGDPGSPEFLFENLTPYSAVANFTFFSAAQLFAPVESNVTDVDFFLPGTSTVAYTTGFGAVFTDVEIAGSSSLAFFDLHDNLLGTFAVPVAGNLGLSFLGVFFDAGEQVGRVRLTSGTSSFTDPDCVDYAVMDDFIYGEPQAAATAVPEPTGALLLLAGAIATARFRRRKG